MQNRLEKVFHWSLFLFGLYYYCFRITGFGLEYTPGDYGDSRFIHYVLEHGYKWLLGIDPNFWKANFMHPFDNNIAVSDCMAGVLPIYALFRFLHFDSESSYQLWWITCCALNYLCAAWAFRKMKLNPYASALGAFLFAFGISNLNQFMHLQINCKFFMPIAIAQLYLFHSTFKIKHYAFALLAFLFQFYSNAYLFIFLVLFTGFLILFYLLYQKRGYLLWLELKGKKLLYMFLMLIPFFALFYLVAEPYYSMNRMFGPLPYSSIASSLPWLFSYFLPHENVLTWHFLKFSPIKQDPAWYIHDIFPGVLVVLSFLAGLICIVFFLSGKQKRYFPAVLLTLSILILILLFSRTRDYHSFFEYFQSWPGFSNMRLPIRFMTIVVFGSIWLGVWLISRAGIKFQLPAAIITLLLIFADNRFEVREGTLRTSSSMRRYRTEAMKELIRQSNKNNHRMIAVLNLSNEDETFQLDVMHATQQLNLQTFNGYSSTCIGELCLAFHEKQRLKLKKWLKQYWIDEKKVTFINI